MNSVVLIVMFVFLAVAAFLVWNRMATGRLGFGKTMPAAGDPMNRPPGEVRNPDDMNASLEYAEMEPFRDTRRR